MRIARKRLVDDYLIGAEVWITHSLVNLGEDSYVTRAKTYNHPSEFGSKHTVDMERNEIDVRTTGSCVSTCSAWRPSDNIVFSLGQIPCLIRAAR
jgi:hypothetical protein